MGLARQSETLQATGRSGSARAPWKAKCIPAAGNRTKLHGNILWKTNKSPNNYTEHSLASSYNCSELSLAGILMSQPLLDMITSSIKVLFSAFLYMEELDFLGCNCCNSIVLPCHHINTFLAQTLEYVEAIHNAGRRIRIQPFSSWTSLHSFIFHAYLIPFDIYYIYSLLFSFSSIILLACIEKNEY